MFLQRKRLCLFGKTSFVKENDVSFPRKLLAYLISAAVTEAIFIFFAVLLTVYLTSSFNQEEATRRRLSDMVETFAISYAAAFQDNNNNVKRSFVAAINIIRKQNGICVILLRDDKKDIIVTYPHDSDGFMNVSLIGEEFQTFKIKNKLFAKIGQEIILDNIKKYYVEIIVPINDFYKTTMETFMKAAVIVSFVVFIFIILLYVLVDKIMRPIHQISRDINKFKHLSPSAWKQLRQGPSDYLLNGIIISVNELIFRVQRSLVCQENLGRFLSHEIKTPLTNLMNEIEMEAGVLPGGTRGNFNQKFCLQATKDIMRIRTIVNNVCELAYIDSDMCLEKSFNIVELLTSFLREFEHIYKFKVNFINASKSKGGAINVNADYFWILCSNILRNSFEHGNAHMFTPTVQLSEDEVKYKIEFADKGNGFPFSSKILNDMNNEENLGQLLKSHGAGIVLCLKLSEIMNIDIEFRNKMPCGACVTILVYKN